MPEDLKTTELCLAAVTQHFIALVYVPEEFKTTELCLAAVTELGKYALMYVPVTLRAKVWAEVRRTISFKEGAV
ncbi:hypothetical protein AGMMS49940_23710 [Spirochaetia bacterium]|nr:hypothetical protein AGMMS49940_23710 [Spirochaetia bacterium]